MARRKDYSDQNSRWTDKKEKAPVKYAIKNHPWTHTNRFIKVHQDKIWTEDITPENNYIINYNEKKGLQK